MQERHTDPEGVVAYVELGRKQGKFAKSQNRGNFG